MFVESMFQYLAILLGLDSSRNFLMVVQKDMLKDHACFPKHSLSTPYAAVSSFGQAASMKHLLRSR